MPRLLVHSATGPENPTLAALGLLVALENLGGLPVSMAPPDRLVDLASWADRVVVY